MPATYEPIATTTLGSSQATVTFSSISALYTDIIAICSVAGNGVDSFGMRFNLDTGSNYAYTRFISNGTSATALSEANITVLKVGLVGTTTISAPDTFITHIQNYSNTTTFKTVVSRSASTDHVTEFIGQWRDTGAIDSIRFQIENTASPSFLTGSTFTLYGIKAA